MVTQIQITSEKLFSETIRTITISANRFKNHTKQFSISAEAILSKNKPTLT